MCPRRRVGGNSPTLGLGKISIKWKIVRNEENAEKRERERKKGRKSIILVNQFNNFNTSCFKIIRKL